jgi:hypothetical protein
MIFNSSYTFLGDATSGTAIAGATSDIDFRIEGAYMIFGAEMIYEHAANGDYVALQIIDKDNIIGAGANYVLCEWVKKWYVPFAETRWKCTSEMTTVLPPGLYARLKYTSTGATDVPVKINYFMIWP